MYRCEVLLIQVLSSNFYIFSIFVRRFDHFWMEKASYKLLLSLFIIIIVIINITISIITLIITTTKFSNLIGYQLSWFQH